LSLGLLLFVLLFIAMIDWWTIFQHVESLKMIQKFTLRR
jgi:hypothetical protein